MSPPARPTAANNAPQAGAAVACAALPATRGGNAAHRHYPVAARRSPVPRRRALPVTPPSRRAWLGACLALLCVLSLVPAAKAQRPGCGLGLGLQAMRAGDVALAGGGRAESLSAGRAAGEEATPLLRDASARFAGCGCPRMAELAAEAAGLAEQLGSEATLNRLRGTAERARFSLGLLRDHAGRQACG